METRDFLPKWIAWEVTRRCNLNCIHCRSASTMESEEGDFPLETAKEFLDDVSSLSKPTVVITGGEPLLRGDVWDIVAHGTEKGLRMCMATNGTLVDDAVCREMKRTGIKMVSLSLDGSTPEIHDDFRKQPGAYEGVIKAVELLKKHGIPFLINSSFTKRNAYDIPNVYAKARELGARAWYMFIVLPVGRGEEANAELLNAEESEKWLNWHYQLEKELILKGDTSILVRPTCAPHYYRIFNQNAKRDGLNLKRRNLSFGTGGSKGCVAGQFIAYVDCHGWLKPCSYFPTSDTNILETPFHIAWFESEIMRNLRKPEKFKGRCGKCEYLKVCGGCRVRAYWEYGDYMEEDPICRYTPLKMRGKEKP
jgi:radical SAM protein with 4Fe4S-binding SPASM domain